MDDWKHTVQTQHSRWKKSARSWKNCKRLGTPKKFIKSTRRKMLLPKDKDKNDIEVVLEDGRTNVTLPELSYHISMETLRGFEGFWTRMTYRYLLSQESPTRTT